MMKQTLLALTIMSLASVATATTTVGEISTKTTDNTVKYVSIVDRVDKGVTYAGFKVTDKNAGTKPTAANKNQSFKHMAERADKWISKITGIAKRDSNNVVVAHMYKMPTWIPGMPDHTVLGRISFKQVGNMDVWYGDWESVPAKGDAKKDASNYSVYYSGQGATTHMPTSGKATYEVTGINKHQAFDTPVLKGNLEADFSQKTLKGTIARSDLSITMDTKIENNKFSGTAVANSRLQGKATGHFFGSNATGLAGIATFKDTKDLNNVNNVNNTAFGGVKK